VQPGDGRPSGTLCRIGRPAQPGIEHDPESIGCLDASRNGAAIPSGARYNQANTSMEDYGPCVGFTFRDPDGNKLCMTSEVA
jgi:hypothetical protein